jgi:hypothetical protein
VSQVSKHLAQHFDRRLVFVLELRVLLQRHGKLLEYRRFSVCRVYYSTLGALQFFVRAKQISANCQVTLEMRIECPSHAVVHFIWMFLKKNY